MTKKNSKKSGEGLAVPTPKVRVVSPAPDGTPRASLVLHGAQSARPLSEFSQAVQHKLRGVAVNTEVICTPMANVDIAKLVPLEQPVPTPSGKAATGTARITSAGGRAAQPFDRNPYNFATWEGSQPWLGPAEGEPQKAVSHAEWSSGSDIAQRHTGSLIVRLIAKTPIFVPEGRLKPAGGSKDDEPRHFWGSINAEGKELYGIPGSSIKGVVRTLYEILTNSRLSIVTAAQYRMPIPYRRRTADLWVVADEPVTDRDVRVLRCKVEFTCGSGPDLQHRVQIGRQREPRRWTPDSPEIRQPSGRIDPSNVSDWQVVPYAANLLATGKHEHDWKHLYVKVMKETAVIPAADVKRYQQNLAHQAYQETLEHSLANEQLGRNFYKGVPKGDSRADRELRNSFVSAAISHLEALEKGHLVFAIPSPNEPGRIACFGKNVNFLWPSRHSPAALAAGFMPLEPDKMSLATADSVDRLFGFAGKDSGDSHPFRSRVRFTTFWAIGRLPSGGVAQEMDRVVEMEAVRLAPLTAPAGIKLKARSLYLPPAPPANGGRTLTYDEETTLRGRKLYWHQRAPDDGIRAEHRGERLENGPMASQLPPPIHPLPVNTVFEGSIAFDNLTDVELGALVAAVCPDWLFKEKDTEKFGLKIGKGKPRGLGSVTSKITDVALKHARTAYSVLMASLVRNSDGVLLGAVGAYKNWVDEQAGRRWQDTEMIRDLRALLRIPEQRGCDYEPLQKGGKPYGWMPEFYDPNNRHTHKAAAVGDPQRGELRPPAMKRAHEC